jgi:hypothetical protein
MDLSWWSIEIRDGEFSAFNWRSAWGTSLLEAALSHGAVDWEWHEAPFGVVLEIGFADSEAWDRFRRLPGVIAALDAVPLTSLYVYPGRGGSAGATLPRRTPRPVSGAGAAPLPEEPTPIIVSRPRVEGLPVAV